MVRVSVTLDTKEFYKTLNANGEQWANAVDRTVKDMKTRGARVIAANSADVYNISKARLNPNNKSAHGSLSLSGGLTELEFNYIGPKLPVSDFKGMGPRGYRKQPYIITGEILKGNTAKLGHWNKPHSEGGRYKSRSPWFFIPGVKAPVMRVGMKLGGTMRALSIPQMVASQRHEGRTVEELNELMMGRLRQNLARLGVE